MSFLKLYFILQKVFI